MKKAIVIIGVPGTGKTTLMYKIRGEITFSSKLFFDMPYVCGELYLRAIKGREPRTWAILGKYDDSQERTYAQGTDRMSMAVQPHFAKWVEQCDDYNLLFEGDRLANTKTLRTLLHCGYQVTVVELYADKELLEKRYAKRGSNQKDSFLKGRYTKVENLMSWCVNNPTVKLVHARNETREDGRRILKHLLKEVEA